MNSPLVEPLEARIAPATLLVLNDSDQLLRFNSATPGTIAATVAIGGLGGGEDVVGIDFRPATGQLYGLGLDGTTARLLTIDPVTGATAQIGATFTVSGTSFGFDFNPVADRLRVVSEADENFSINPADGVVTTQTALNPGTPNVVGAAHTNSFPGATSTTLYAIDSGTDVLATITPPSSGTLATVGALGVDTSDVAGFDIGHGKGEAFAALRVGVLSKLYTVNLTSGAVSEVGNIGTGTPNIRGLAVVQHTWTGAVNNQLGTAGNWAAGLAPVSGDSLLFPAGGANPTVQSPYPMGTIFNAIRFTGDGYTLNSVNSARVLDGIYATHATGTTTVNYFLTLGAQNGAAATLDVASATATLAFAQSGIDGTQGVTMTGAGKITIGTFVAPQAGSDLVINGPDVTVTFSNHTRNIALQSGALTIGKVINQTNFTPVTVTGGTLQGAGDVAAVTVNGGAIETDSAGLTINGAFALGAAGTARFISPAAPSLFDPLEVKGTVTLAGTLDFTLAGTTAPARITLIANDGADAVSGTFAGQPEGTILTLLGRAYTLTYAGGDGNDVVLTGATVPIDLVLGGKSATFTDVDGDLVTVAISKGTLTQANFSLRDEGGGRAQLELIDLLGDTDFAGTNLTLTAQRQGVSGDGNVNVGYIKATDLDLGAVKISGDLGAIDAGDATSSTLALKSLSAHSLGVFGFTTGAPDLQSDLDGRVGLIAIRGDVREAILYVFDRTLDTGTLTGGSSGDGQAFIHSLTIGGNLVGGAANNSGLVVVRDGLLEATIGGSIIGGSGSGSGQISSFDSLGDITIRGSLVGGAGLTSGRITAVTDAIGSLTLGGNVVGGTGNSSGNIDISDFDNDLPTRSVTIGGSVLGGIGSSSGIVTLDGPVKSVKIGGSVVAGSGQFSAQVNFEDHVGSFLLGGSLLAGSSSFSAQIGLDKDVGSLTILGSIVGGAGSGSAQVDVGGKVGKLLLGGSLLGGSGSGTAQFDIDELTAGTIVGSIVGGAGNFSGQFESDNSFGSLTVGAIVGGIGTDSGTVIGDRFGKLTVRGDLLGGIGDRSGRIFVTSGDLPALTIGGSIRSGTGASTGGVFVSGALGPVTVGGEIVGTAANPVTIAAGGDVPFGGNSAIGIASLSVKGGVTQARILAGYDEGVTARNADAVIGKVTVGGDWIASSIAAGVAANGEGGFGTADDALISGGGTTNDGALTSRIGSIAIKGQLLGTAGGVDAFGFVAEEIGSVKVGKFSEPLTAAVDAQPLGATDDFIVREDVVGLNVPLPVFAGAAGVNVISTTLATFVDVDGDLVTIKSSKPILDPLDFTSIVSGSGNQLQLIDFTDDGALGSGVSLTITAAPQDLNADGKKDGDGFVNIGRIAAPGVDLGAISITGDLGQLDAGDGTTLKSPGVKSLTVQSLGEFGTSTQSGGDLVSSITGALASLTVKGNLREAAIFVTAATAADAIISKLTLGGSLLGGAAEDSGNIFASGDISSLKIGGSIAGGSGDHSGLLRANGQMGSVKIGGSILGAGAAVVGNLDAGRLSSGGDMGGVKISGDVRGGPGDLSGTIFAGGKLAGLTIGGALVGGDGDHDTIVGQEGQIHSNGDLGKVKIGREILGGAGDRSAQIFSVAKIASVKVGGVVKGGAGEDSGAIRAGAALDAIEIKGDLLGGGGMKSGSVEAIGAVKSFTLAGSLLGGGADSSGQVVGGSFEKAKIGGNITGAADFGTGFFESNGALKSISVGGSILGGTGIDTGQIEAVGDIGKVKIAGDIRGGDASGILTLFCSGFVASDGRIGSITVGGSIVSGIDTSTGLVTNNGAIAAGHDIGSLTVKGSLIGNSTRTVVISARGQALPSATTDLAIGKISIGGQVEFAQILAGYDNNGVQPIEANADGQIGTVKVTGDWIASALVAGVKNRGADNVDDSGFDDDNIDFGNARDQKIAEAADAITSKIASITIKGQALGTVGGLDHFGFVAQEIGALKIGTVKYPLIAGPASAADITGYALGATGDLRVQEVAV